MNSTCCCALCSTWLLVFQGELIEQFLRLHVTQSRLLFWFGLTQVFTKLANTGQLFLGSCYPGSALRHDCVLTISTRLVPTPGYVGARDGSNGRVFCATIAA